MLIENEDRRVYLSTDGREGESEDTGQRTDNKENEVLEKARKEWVPGGIDPRTSKGTAPSETGRRKERQAGGVEGKTERDLQLAFSLTMS